MSQDSDFVDIQLDEQYRPHSFDGLPAITYPDGRKEYYWRGVRVPDYVIVAPERIKLDDINKEANTEVRRVMLEKYGFEKYLRNSKARLRSQDTFGKLWEVPVPMDESLVMVEVLNSTPEPDGSIKTYFLRVPPDTQTCQGGLAWTFGLTEREYKPAFQS